jgi:tetratricopeptide (TPR) repeat protein
MQIALRSPARKLCFVACSVLLMFTYATLAARQWLAGYLAHKFELSSLQRAVRLEAGNAEYHDLLGRYFSLGMRSPQAAAQSYRSAIALNPYKARYWLDLAAAYHWLNQPAQRKDALAHAIQADSTSPDVAWEAANRYLIDGDMNQALQEFRVVLENDPALVSNALRLCWRVKPDASTLLRDVVPPQPEVNAAFLDLLLSLQQTHAASLAWKRIAELRQPIEKSYIFEYIRYLLARKDVDQAQLVWQQSAVFPELAAYQSSPDNLIVNGDFSLPVLNGGFDWLYERSPAVTIALDPAESHSGHRSLQIAFDGAGVADVGIRHLVPVEPNTSYEFSAYFKAPNIEAAGGPQLVIQDMYNGTAYFTTEDMKDADFWKRSSGTFTTASDTRLLVLRLERVTAGSPIRGRLWIDGVRLTRSNSGATPQ